ncbi:MAG: homoserine kinase [Gemmatimonadales bacterium]
MVLHSATAFAPGSVGNLGPGLDILGLALEGPGDTVTITRSSQPGMRVVEPGHPALPTDPSRHSAAIAARAVLVESGHDVSLGVELRVSKGLPLAGGQGGSAASAAAGAVAMNALLGGPLSNDQLILAALEAEAVVAGRHADNVAPSILGGLVLIRSLDPPDFIRLPVPTALWVVLAHPDQQLRTAEGRASLPDSVPRDLALHQAAQVAAIVAGALQNDAALLGRAIDDRIAEPARAPLLPGFREAKGAAMAAGALGCSISGSGPTAFALVSSEADGQQVGEAMRTAYRAAGVACTVRVNRPDLRGARVL